MADGVPEDKKTLTFHLIKGPNFESRKVDGAIGNLAPGGISLTFYIERAAIPQTITHEFTENGILGDITSATGKQGMVREIQTGITLDLDSARGLMNQISKLIDRAQPEQSE